MTFRRKRVIYVLTKKEEVLKMRIEFNRTGAERKALVKAISEITGAEAVYKFMPTCAR